MKSSIEYLSLMFPPSRETDFSAPLPPNQKIVRNYFVDLQALTEIRLQRKITKSSHFSQSVNVT